MHIARSEGSSDCAQHHGFSSFKTRKRIGQDRSPWAQTTIVSSQGATSCARYLYFPASKAWLAQHTIRAYRVNVTIAWTLLMRWLSQTLYKLPSKLLFKIQASRYRTSWWIKPAKNQGGKKRSLPRSRCALPLAKQYRSTPGPMLVLDIWATLVNGTATSFPYFYYDH